MICLIFIIIVIVYSIAIYYIRKEIINSNKRYINKLDKTVVLLQHILEDEYNHNKYAVYTINKAWHLMPIEQFYTLYFKDE